MDVGGGNRVKVGIHSKLWVNRKGSFDGGLGWMLKNTRLLNIEQKRKVTAGIPRLLASGAGNGSSTGNGMEAKQKTIPHKLQIK
jgi:hypothetical protein